MSRCMKLAIAITDTARSSSIGMLSGLPKSARCFRCACRNRISQLQQKRQRTTPAGSPYRKASEARDSNFNVASERVPSLIRREVFGSSGRRQGLRRPGFLRKEKEEKFNKDLEEICDAVKNEVRSSELVRDLTQRSREGEPPISFRALWNGFVQEFELSYKRAPLDSPFPFASRQTRASTSFRHELQGAARVGGRQAVASRIKNIFLGYAVSTQFSAADVANQKALADLRYPTEWFPATRHMTRTIHLHVGPTNSGKTYAALKRLEEAKSGTYAGPLRLLAHEVYTRLNAKGRACTLITGEERRPSPSALEDDQDITPLVACTVEMLSLNSSMEVAVIDEIQMIGSSERGWAWTQAFLGVKATEVHLCGEERTVPLIRELCASIGEKLEVHRYQRLSPLEVAPKSLDGDLGRLRKGDCVVSFSVMGIHALRRQIEKKTGRKVATVYGSLPPETRAQQARLFNDPNNDYDFLVASDAIGMGLNLAIKRVIFESSAKFDGNLMRTLPTADIKQIGGRAGRFRTAAQVNESPADFKDLVAAKGDAVDAASSARSSDDSVGLVTTLERFDYPIISAAMTSDPEPIMSAGIHPPSIILTRFASYFPPGTPFSYMLTRLHELCQMHQRFHLCGLRDIVWVADIIEPVKNLTIDDRNTICLTPAAKSDHVLWTKLMPAYARCVAEQKAVNIVDIEELPIEVLEVEPDASREYLLQLERLHKGVVAYLWLSFRFAGIFGARPQAQRLKILVEEKIEHTLGRFSFTDKDRERRRQLRQKSILAAWEEAQQAGREAEEARERGEHSEATENPPATAENPNEPGMRVGQALAEESLKDMVEDPEDAESDLRRLVELIKYSHPPDEESSVTLGGDHFSGEQEDIVLDQPDDTPVGVEEQDAKISERFDSLHDDNVPDTPSIDRGGVHDHVSRDDSKVTTTELQATNENQSSQDKVSRRDVARTRQYTPESAVPEKRENRAFASS